MMYPYATLADDTLITHSHILDRDGVSTVEVHFERPTDDDFDMARCSLPTYEWIIWKGFNSEEKKAFEQILVSGAHLFFKYAEIGGAEIAKAV